MNKLDREVKCDLICMYMQVCRNVHNIFGCVGLERYVCIRGSTGDTERLRQSRFAYNSAEQLCSPLSIQCNLLKWKD